MVISVFIQFPTRNVYIWTNLPFAYFRIFLFVTIFEKKIVAMTYAVTLVCR